MHEAQVFIMADQALNHVVQQVQPDQWNQVMPVEFQARQSDHLPTLLEILQYHAYDDAWIPDMFAGRTMDEIGPESYDGDLLGSDPKAAFNTLVAKACAAAQLLTNPEQILHFSYGDYSVKEGIWHVISFRGLRAHDIAEVIGVNTKLPDELVQAMWDAFEPRANEWREMGVFGPQVEVSPDASLQDRLLGLTGRQPDSNS